MTPSSPHPNAPACLNPACSLQVPTALGEGSGQHPSGHRCGPCAGVGRPWPPVASPRLGRARAAAGAGAPEEIVRIQRPLAPSLASRTWGRRPIKSELNPPGPEESDWGKGAGRGHCRRPQDGSQGRETGRFPRQGDSRCYGRGRWGRRWGRLRAWNGRGTPSSSDGAKGAAEQGWPPWRRKGTGNRAKMHAQRGQGAASLAPQHPIPSKLESHRLSGAPTLRSPDLSWVVGAHPSPRHSHWERTRGAQPPAAATAVPLAWGPPSGPLQAAHKGSGREPQPPLPPAAAARGERQGPGRHAAPLSQPRVRARQPLSQRPGLSFPPRKWVQGSPSSGRRRGARAAPPQPRDPVRQPRTHHSEAEVLRAGRGRAPGPAGRQREQIGRAHV